MCIRKLVNKYLLLIRVNQFLFGPFDLFHTVKIGVPEVHSVLSQMQILYCNCTHLVKLPICVIVKVCSNNAYSDCLALQPIIERYSDSTGLSIIMPGPE